ncbi:MAG: tail fiber domain-containing protein [Bacteroidales bacterium]
MKKFTLLLFLFFINSILIYGQVPEIFNYQGVLRNSSGELIKESNVSLQISIIEDNPDGNIAYSEIHTVTTNAYGQFAVKVGGGEAVGGDFSSINWSLGQTYLKLELDENGGSAFTELGTFQLLSVPYALNANSAARLGNNVEYLPSTDTLFVVRDYEGNPVFIVYPDGAEVVTNSGSKGKVGGFAVSGRTSTKAPGVNLLTVNADSTRIYVNEGSVKGKVGGFAVSGRTSTKNIGYDLLKVTTDSTRIFVNDDQSKGKIGGFAVSGRTSTKGLLNNYLQVAPDSTRIFVKDSVGGFGISNIQSGVSESFLNLNKQNYLIGHKTGDQISEGKYNSMIGYEAGFTTSSGSNNLFLGFRSGYSNVTGGNNVFIGTESGYVNQYTFQNTYVGYRSGYELSGASNTVLGSMSGENASGFNNTFIGTSAGRIATGGNNTFVGQGAGYGFPDENQGVRNTYIGQASGSKTTTGSYNVMLGFNSGYLNYAGANNTFLGYNTGRNITDGSGNIFIGYEAGKNIEDISNRLVIENSDADSTTALIYGKFDQDDLRINATVGIGSPASQFYGLRVNGGTSLNYSLYAYKGGYTPGSWSSGSDIRLKKDIRNIDTPLKKIKQLNGVSFLWKVNEFPDKQLSSKGQIGVIAQEVEKVLPELVFEDDEGFKAVAYDKLNAVLIEAIKEQQKTIEKQEQEILSLKDRLLKIENMLEEMNP